MIQKLVNYIDNLSAIGITVDYAYLEGLYLNIAGDIRDKASVLLLPVAASSGVVYGMNNITGDVIPFTFSRTTGATLFDKDLNLQTVGSNIPRIDYGNYSDGAKLLIEKESTNFAKNDISVIEIRNGAASLIDDSFLFTESTNTIHHQAYLPDPSQPAGTYYGSILLKYNGRRYVQIRINPNTANPFRFVNIDLLKGLVTYQSGVTVNITPIRDFYRIELVSYTPSYPLICITGTENPLSTDALPSYTGDGVSGFYFKYGQLELSTNTSYIPTSVSQVTRSADMLSINLQRELSVYLKTTRRETISEKERGLWNIHEDLNNEGIEVLAIMPKESISSALLATGELIESEGGRVTGALVATGELIESEGGRITDILLEQEEVEYRNRCMFL